jgi:hypothetical protein
MLSLALETGITPLTDPGCGGRRAGTGQIGVGVPWAPLGPFTTVREALARARGRA